MASECPWSDRWEPHTRQIQIMHDACGMTYTCLSTSEPQPTPTLMAFEESPLLSNDRQGVVEKYRRLE